MGLDTVELVIEFEATFAVSIPDADAEGMRTIGDVVDWLMPRLDPLGRPARSRCASQRLFYRLRASMAREFGVSRSQVRPGRLVCEIIADGPARKRWSRFAVQNGLDRPKWSLFKVSFVEDNVTIRDLVRQAVVRDSRNFYDGDGRLDRDRVLAVVLRITSEQMGVAVEDLHEGIRFIEDLNAG